MAQDAFQFRLSLERLGRELPAEMVQQVTRKLALQALNGVVMKSPVDTGRFRGNWNVSVDHIDYTTTEDIDKGGQATIAKGSGTIAKIQPYQVVWLSNNLGYARRLETGWSKQAPAGVVALTVAELQVGLAA